MASLYSSPVSYLMSDLSNDYFHDVSFFTSKLIVMHAIIFFDGGCYLLINEL